MSLIGLLMATEKQVWAGRLHMRPIQWHLKRHWHVPESLEKVIPIPLSPPTSRLVAGGGQYSQGSALAPPSTRSADIYRHLKRRLGHTLRGVHVKRHLVRTRKPFPHQFLGAKSSLSGPQEFRASLKRSDCSDSNGQHNCSLLHQQGGRYEIRLSLCPTLETPLLVSSQKDSAGGETHPRSLDCHSGQTAQTQSSDTDRVVPVSAGFPSLVFKVGPA